MNTKVSSLAKSRLGGRTKGTTNKAPLEKIKASRGKLEKMLLDKALAGDVTAIQACLELIEGETEPVPEEPIRPP